MIKCEELRTVFSKSLFSLQDKHVAEVNDLFSQVDEKRRVGQCCCICISIYKGEITAGCEKAVT